MGESRKKGRVHLADDVVELLLWELNALADKQLNLICQCLGRDGSRV